jgi:hypothetical protein
LSRVTYFAKFAEQLWHNDGARLDDFLNQSTP